MDGDVCHDRRCWASLSGQFTGDVLEGGRVDATTWPVQPGQAIDVWFNKSTDPDIGTWDAGYFRGVTDKVTKPSAKGIQTLEVDYPDTMTSGALELVRQQLLDPKDAPTKPTVEQGEVAVRVPPEALPEVEETATPYGLTPEQHAKLKELWYERGHYSSRDRMWKLLQDQAREDGELQERTVNRKDGPVTVATPYGIRYRQLGQWIRAQESMQLFKRPATVNTYRSFILPATPLKTLFIDTLDLGRWGGGAQGRQRYVISVIDPASRWVYSEIAPQRLAPTPQDSRAVVINGLLSLRDGILEHDGANRANVFDSDGALVHELTLVSDNGNELGGGKPHYREVLAEKLLAQGLIRDSSMFKHRYTLSQTPSQAAFIERFNQTLRQKLRLAVQSELGSISQSRAADERIKMTNPKAWRALISRAVEANNEEMAAGTGMSPNEYMERFVRDGKQAVAREIDGNDTGRTAKAQKELERQQELTVGTRVRLVNTATQKAELRGARKMQARFSQEVFTVASVSKQSRKGSGNVSYLYGLKRANGQEKAGRYHREQLQIVPEMRTEWNPGPSKGRAFIDKLRADNVISGWDSKHNRFERTGKTWSEQEVDLLGERAWKRVGMTREKTLRRLEQYMKQGMSKPDALKRLSDSLQSNSGPANPGKLAIMGIDD